MGTDTLQQEADKLIGQLKAESEGKDLNAGEALGTLYRALAAFAVLAKQIVPAMGEGDLRDFVIRNVQKVYDEVIAPMDIPFLPNIIEQTVDDAIGSAIPTLVGWAYDALKQAISDATGETSSDPVLILGLKK